MSTESTDKERPENTSTPSTGSDSVSPTDDSKTEPTARANESETPETPEITPPPQIVVNLNVSEENVQRLAEVLASSATINEADPEPVKESPTPTTNPPAEETREISPVIQSPIETTAEPIAPSSTAPQQHDLAKEIADHNKMMIKIGAGIVIFLLLIVCAVLFFNWKEKQDTSDKIMNQPVIVSTNTNKNTKSDIVIPQAVAVSSEESEAVMPEIYKKIANKYADEAKKHAPDDDYIRETVGNLIFNNPQISAIIDANIRQLRLKGMPEIKAVPLAFDNENVIEAILLVLPESLKELPDIRDSIRVALNEISSVTRNQMTRDLL